MRHAARGIIIIAISWHDSARDTQLGLPVHRAFCMRRIKRRLHMAHTLIHTSLTSIFLLDPLRQQTRTNCMLVIWGVADTYLEETREGAEKHSSFRLTSLPFAGILNTRTAGGDFTSCYVLTAIATRQGSKAARKQRPIRRESL